MTATHFDNSELSLKGLRFATGMTKYFKAVKMDTLYLKF